MLHIPSLYILETEEKGRGIFTGEEIMKDSVIEVCPLLLIPHEHIPLIDKTIVYDYYFVYPDDSKRICVALGYGSLYNHSTTPNAHVIFDLDREEIVIEALHDIEAGSEILIDYTGGDRSATELWFQER